MTKQTKPEPLEAPPESTVHVFVGGSRDGLKFDRSGRSILDTVKGDGVLIAEIPGQAPCLECALTPSSGARVYRSPCPVPSEVGGHEVYMQTSSNVWTYQPPIKKPYWRELS